MNVNKKLIIILNHLICLVGGFHTPIANIAHNSNRRCTNKSITNNDNYNYQYQHKDVTILNLSNNINDDDNNDEASKTALRLATTSGDDNKRDGNIYIQSSTISKVFTSVLATALSSILLFSNISAQPTLYANAKTAPETEMTTPQITTTTTKEGQIYTPPKITTSSSSTALSLGQTLKSLDSKMYGAYWCSHCYEQKQTLGKEVFFQKYVTYIECDKEGLDSQRSLCKERKVPGYPTWEIGGKLFPGEQSIGELEDIASEMASALNVK